jgi:arsenate reductase
MSICFVTPQLADYVSTLKDEFLLIPDDRKELLRTFADYVRGGVESEDEIKLTFICTHNSRRSHLSQIWASVAAAYYGIEKVDTYSGGTEATAFNPRAVKAMRDIGFVIEIERDGENPLYKVAFCNELEPMPAFSKVYDQEGNPTESFAAIMTCDHADANCPFIPGAEKRFPIRYEDPKAFDDTDREEDAYLERSRQIAREMFYAFSLV